jgi:hypothetical protein
MNTPTQFRLPIGLGQAIIVAFLIESRRPNPYLFEFNRGGKNVSRQKENEGQGV